MRNWILRDGIHQPDPQRLIRSDHFRQQKHLHGPRFADQSRQALCSAPAGHHSQACAAVPKDGVWRGHAIVARQRQVHGSAHAVAANGRDYWHGKLVDRQHERLATTGKLKGFWPAELGNLVQIGPGGKELAIAGDDEGFDLAAFRLAMQLLRDAMQRTDAGDPELIGTVRRD